MTICLLKYRIIKNILESSRDYITFHTLIILYSTIVLMSQEKSLDVTAFDRQLFSLQLRGLYVSEVGHIMCIITMINDN